MLARVIPGVGSLRRSLTAESLADLVFPRALANLGKLSTGTCGHDRPTAATRCAEVRSSIEPAVPDERRRAQASKVFVVARPGLSNIEIRLRNSSEQPIYDLAVRWSDTAKPEHFSPLMPGLDQTFYPAALVPAWRVPLVQLGGLALADNSLRRTHGARCIASRGVARAQLAYERLGIGDRF